jgi:hypothetical protein
VALRLDALEVSHANERVIERVNLLAPEEATLLERLALDVAPRTTADDEAAAVIALVPDVMSTATRDGLPKRRKASRIAEYTESGSARSTRA